MLVFFAWSRFKFFVYSAYYDDRVSGAGTPAGKNQGVVRVISATKTRGPERVWCRLWYRQQNGANVTASVTVAAKVKVHPLENNSVSRNPSVYWIALEMERFHMTNSNIEMPLHTMLFYVPKHLQCIGISEGSIDCYKCTQDILRRMNLVRFIGSVLLACLNFLKIIPPFRSWFSFFVLNAFSCERLSSLRDVTADQVVEFVLRFSGDTGELESKVQCLLRDLPVA